MPVRELNEFINGHQHIYIYINSHTPSRKNSQKIECAKLERASIFLKADAYIRIKTGVNTNLIDAVIRRENMSIRLQKYGWPSPSPILIMNALAEEPRAVELCVLLAPLEDYFSVKITKPLGTKNCPKNQILVTNKIQEISTGHLGLV